MIEHVAALILCALYIVAVVYAVSWRVAGSLDRRDDPPRD